MITVMIKRIPFIFLMILGVLLIPYLAMQFSQEVNWSVFDFMAMGFLLFAAGVTVDLIFGKAQAQYRWLIILGVVLLFLLLWAELAVGVFGTPWAGN